MAYIIDLLNAIFTIIFSLEDGVTKEDIEKNLKYLKQEKWFQAYLNNEEYNQLIANNENVRIVIGSIQIKKMTKPSYYKKQQIRIERVLKKQLQKIRES